MLLKSPGDRSWDLTGGCFPPDGIFGKGSEKHKRTTLRKTTHSHTTYPPSSSIHRHFIYPFLALLNTTILSPSPEDYTLTRKARVTKTDSRIFFLLSFPSGLFSFGFVLVDWLPTTLFHLTLYNYYQHGFSSDLFLNFFSLSLSHTHTRAEGEGERSTDRTRIERTNGRTVAYFQAPKVFEKNIKG